MSGALVDLVSKGAQDAYITGEPQVSFFRQNYKRHANFAQQVHRLNFSGNTAAGSEITIPIPSKGDLLSYVWIEAKRIGEVNGGGGIFNNQSTSFSEISLHIGGQKVVSMDALFINGCHNIVYKDSQAKVNSMPNTRITLRNSWGADDKVNHFTFPFFFCEDWTKSLPLVALQYHQVEIKVKFSSDFYLNATQDEKEELKELKVFGNYIYLDTDERDYFVNTNHEILIPQVQTLLLDSPTQSEIDLSFFNHPCKAIHVVGVNSDVAKWYEQYIFNSSTLYINGTPIFENVSDTFTHNVVHENHTQFLPDFSLYYVALYTWPFSLCLSKQQPTGTLNFSRLDNAKLMLDSPTVGPGTTSVRVYAVNYNILRIKNGMAGVAFSN